MASATEAEGLPYERLLAYNVTIAARSKREADALQAAHARR